METTNAPERQVLLQWIETLEAHLAELKRRLPAHSLPPALMAEMDELDEALRFAQEQLAALDQ